MGGDGEKKEGEEEKKEENGGNEAKEEDKVGESWFYFLPFFFFFLFSNIQYIVNSSKWLVLSWLLFELKGGDWGCEVSERGRSIKSHQGDKSPQSSNNPII